MADRLVATSDSTTSYFYDEEVFMFGLANASSALTGSGGTIYLAGPMKANGRVTDFVIAVGTPAVSASGFISCNISANLRVNSVSCLSTIPAIYGPLGSAGAARAQATNAVSTSAAGVPAATSAVVNSASANFSAGDFLLLDYNLLSGGSAAAGAAGTGFWATARVRYAAA